MEIATPTQLVKTSVLMFLAICAPYIMRAQEIATVPSCVTPSSGLAHWWPGEGNANDVVDGSHGTLFGGMGFAAGEVGQAFSFDGVNDYVSFGNTAGNFGTNDFTIDFWIKTTSTRHEAILEKWPLCGFSSMFTIRMEGSVGGGKLGLAMSSDNAGNNYGSFVSRQINDGVFHHAALVRQGTNLAFYIDGTMDATSSTPGVTSISNAVNLVAGTSACGAVDTFNFTGQLDEISINSRALTAGEIQSIYNAGSAGKCPPPPPPSCVPAPSGLVSWWPAEGNANDVVDGNSGIITTQFLGQMVFSAGEVGQAFDFHGTNYVEIPAIPLNSFTLDFWLKQRTRGAEPVLGSILASAEACGAVDDWGVSILPGGRIRVQIGDHVPGGASYFDSAASIPLNTFAHVGVTRSTITGKVEIYLNGMLDSTFNSPHNRVLGAENPTCDTDIHQNRIGIGNLRRQAILGGNNQAFDGLIDEVSIYNRALSTNEIQAIYNAGSAGKCPPPTPPSCVPAPSGLVSWWRAEGNAFDITGANDGVLAGNATYAQGGRMTKFFVSFVSFV